jgi:hypothetical protein
LQGFECMGRKKSDEKKRPTVVRETLRRLDAVTLSPEDLAQVAGGTYGPRITRCCTG